LGSAVSFLRVTCGGAFAKIEFDALQFQNMRFSGNNFNKFLKNKLTNWHIQCSLSLWLCLVRRNGEGELGPLIDAAGLHGGYWLLSLFNNDVPPSVTSLPA